MSDESPITTIAELLAESQLEHLQPVVGTSSLASLDSVLNEGGRVKLLAHLQRLGVTKLPERQKCANSLSKAQRVGRLKPSTDEHDRPPQPAPVETPKSAAVDISDNTPSLPSLPPPPPRDPKQPLRVLCLHSFRANAAILEQQMNLTGQATFFDGLAEFTYLDAPCTRATDLSRPLGVPVPPPSHGYACDGVPSVQTRAMPRTRPSSTT